MANVEAYSAIFGNDSLKKTLIGFTDRAAFPNSLLFTGPSGSGKTTLATLAAMAIACQGRDKPCLRCEACRKISSGLCPDFTVIGPVGDRKTVGVEAVRTIRETVYLKPNDLDVRIYLLKEADRMTPQAQNALLKLFEEPPRGVYFFLLAASPSALLPTVRSRAPELKTERFAEERMAEFLLSEKGEAGRRAQELQASDPVAFRRILHASEGSIGRALSLLLRSDGGQEEDFDGVEKLLSLLSGTNRADFLLSLSTSAQSREGFGEQVKLLSLALRDMTAVKECRGEVSLLFFADTRRARDFAGSFSLKSLLSFGDALDSLSALIEETNVNLQTAALVFGEKIWGLK